MLCSNSHIPASCGCIFVVSLSLERIETEACKELARALGSAQASDPNCNIKIDIFDKSVHSQVTTAHHPCVSGCSLGHCARS